MSDQTEKIHNLKRSILSFLHEKLESYDVYGSFPGSKHLSNKKSLYLTLEGLGKPQQTSTGQLSIDIPFELYVVQPVKDETEIASVCASLLIDIQSNSFGIPDCEGAEVEGAEDTNFDQFVDGLEIWAINWSHNMILGEDRSEELYE